MTKGITIVMKYNEESSRNWSPDPQINSLFVTTIFNWSADTLKARGYLFLNDILDQLGMPRTSQGQLVGWLYSEKETWWVMESSSEEEDEITLKFYTHGEMYDKIEELS